MGAYAYGEEGVFVILAAALLIFVAIGAWRGFLGGFARTLTLFAGAFAAWVSAVALGAPVGHAVFDGSRLPWLLRPAVGVLLVAALILVLVRLWLWWRQVRVPGGAVPDRRLSGAILGATLGFGWFAFWLYLLLFLAAVGSLVADASGDPVARMIFSWPVRVRETLAAHPLTAPLGDADPLPPKLRRTVPKLFATLRDEEAFRRLRDDEEVRALASHPAFYPLVKDEEIGALLKRHDFYGLLSHPKVSALMADDDFQRKIAATDCEALLDRALAGDVHTSR